MGSWVGFMAKTSAYSKDGTFVALLVRIGTIGVLVNSTSTIKAHEWEKQEGSFSFNSLVDTKFVYPRDHYVGLLPLSIQLEVFSSFFFSATWISHFRMPDFVTTIEIAIISKWPNQCSLRGTLSSWGCLKAGWHHSTLSWASEIQLYPDLEIYHKRHQ